MNTNVHDLEDDIDKLIIDDLLDISDSDSDDDDFVEDEILEHTEDNNDTPDVSENVSTLTSLLKFIPPDISTMFFDEMKGNENMQNVVQGMFNKFNNKDATFSFNMKDTFSKFMGNCGDLGNMDNDKINDMMFNGMRSMLGDKMNLCDITEEQNASVIRFLDYPEFVYNDLSKEKRLDPMTYSSLSTIFQIRSILLSDTIKDKDENMKNMMRLVISNSIDDLLK
jgi:hypothetical protein